MRSDVQSTYIAADANAADADSVCTAEQLSGGGEQAIPIDGADASGGVATFTAARKITVTAAGADGARTVTVTGTDVDGNTQTEEIGVTASGVSTGTLYFRTVTAVTVDDDTASTLSVGMADDALDVVFGGRMRLRGLHLVHSDAAGNIAFRDGGAAAAIGLQLGTVASATATDSFQIRDSGVVFENGAYLAYLVSAPAFSSVTVFYS